MKSTHPNYEKDLEKLAKLLRRKPLTAREISVKLRCCVPTAYQRVRELERRGTPVRRQPAKKVGTGPRALAFAIEQ